MAQLLNLVQKRDKEPKVNTICLEIVTLMFRAHLRVQPGWVRASELIFVAIF